jgi:hypothetical protein
MIGVMYSPASGLKIGKMREVIAAAGNATKVAANELRNTIWIAKEFVVAGGHGTTEKAVARVLMSDATILVTGRGASNDTSEGLTVARDTVVGLSGSTSAGSMAVATVNVASNGLVSGGSAKIIMTAADLMTDVSTSVVPRDAMGDTLSASGTKRTLRRAWRHGASGLAGRLRKSHGRRHREMGQGDPGGQHQARVGPLGLSRYSITSR